MATEQQHISTQMNTGKSVPINGKEVSNSSNNDDREAREEQVLTLDDIEAAACKCLPSAILEYYRGGADHMTTLQESTQAYSK